MSPARFARRNRGGVDAPHRTRAQRQALRQLRAALADTGRHLRVTQPPLTLATYLHAVAIWGDDTAQALTDLGMAEPEQVSAYWRICLSSDLIAPSNRRRPAGMSLTPTGHAVLTALADAGTRPTYVPRGARP